jgi:hypothetical protein
MASNFSRDEAGNITIKQGTTVSWSYSLQDADGNPLDLTGWKARAQVRSTFNSTVPLISISTESGGIEIDLDTGSFINMLLPIDTSYTTTSGVKVVGEALEGVYDYEVEDPEGNVIRIDEGTFTITREVTRE